MELFVIIFIALAILFFAIFMFLRKNSQDGAKINKLNSKDKTPEM